MADQPLAAVRHERIVSLVRERSYVRAADLAEMFGVSTVTIRTDLGQLEQAGLLRRVRGGAMPAGSAVRELPYEVTEQSASEEKNAIGRHAAAMVEADETIALDVGTTTAALARALVERVARGELANVTVITNSITIAFILEPVYPAISVVVTGGTLRPMQHSLVNPLGTVLIDQLRPTLAFVGCNGVDVEGGITNINLAEAEIKRAMLRSARRRVVVADSSKFGEIELAQIATIDEIGLIVSDSGVDQDLLDAIGARGTRVEIAKQ